MNKYGDVDTGCRMVGVYVDEGDSSVSIWDAAVILYHVELTRFVANSVDDWNGCRSNNQDL